MARLKPNVKKIESLEDANLTLKEIGLLERELETIDGDAHKQIYCFRHENIVKQPV
jgi:hypothetical protein